MTITSRFYVGKVMHGRLVPVEHRLEYPIYAYALDVDELPELDASVRGFGYNRVDLVSIYDRDYLRGDGSIREKLMAFLEERGCGDDVARIELVTMPRVFGYCFNPVSFYYCRRRDGSPRCHVAEVNNTFGERHLYILDAPTSASGALPVKYRHDKQFHVSPFNDRRGHYTFSFSELDEKMRIGITLVRDGKKILTAWLQGEQRPLTTNTLLLNFLRCPLTAALSVPRISWHAMQLYYRRKLKLYHKPGADHPMTIGVRAPTHVQKRCLRLVERLFDRIEHGRVTLVLPDGSNRVFGNADGREHIVYVRDYNFFSRTVCGGSVGFGESYMRGEWDAEDLAGLLRLFLDNRDTMSEPGSLASRAVGLRNRLRHFRNRNTRLRSRRNIRAHYDVGNEFYKVFLDDETMLYSCGVFTHEDASLADAQREKARRIVAMADLAPDDHVLEIGCGWGGFAILAAAQIGCRVTGITLSEEQYRLARDRVGAAGLADRVTIEMCDYRDMTGTFDKIVSIEMLEAVGHAYYGTFFAACDRLLKPGGRAAIQVITIPDQRYDAYRRNPDWIQMYIFPGGILPSLDVLTRAMTRHSTLLVDRLENIGPHYARTLREWRARFVAGRERMEALGLDEEFQRKWIYYFSYCEAGFAARLINDLQLVLKRAEP